jgi:hypothetical protein
MQKKVDNNAGILYAVARYIYAGLEDEMDRNIPWEPLPGLGVHEQIAKLVDDFIRETDPNAIPLAWVPLMDLPKLRPN